MKRLAAVLFLLASPAYAQQPAPKTYTLTVTDADLAVIAEGLGEVPSKRANPVIVKLQQQVNPVADAAKAEDKAAPTKP